MALRLPLSMEGTMVIRSFCAFAALAVLAGAAAAAEPSQRNGKQVVDEVCSACHAAGVNGAPRIGDRDAWIQRARQGIDALTRSAIRGHGRMPSRGGMAPLYDEEMRAAVTYMVNYSLKAGAPSSYPPAKP
jgi:cytochrome c5